MFPWVLVLVLPSSSQCVPSTFSNQLPSTIFPQTINQQESHCYIQVSLQPSTLSISSNQCQPCFVQSNCFLPLHPCKSTTSNHQLFFILNFFFILQRIIFYNSILFPKSHKILKMKQQKLSHTFTFTDKNMLNILVRGQKLYLVNNILWEEYPAKPQASFPPRIHLIAFGFIQSRKIEVKLPRILLNPVERKENASCQHNHLNSNMAHLSGLLCYWSQYDSQCILLVWKREVLLENIPT